MIISKKDYLRLTACLNEAATLIEKQDTLIKIQKREIAQLKRLISDFDIPDIDFPNSTKGGNEDSNIFFM